MLTILSPKTISPELICSNPASIRSDVDLPQPEGPRRETNSPSFTSMFNSLTAIAPPP